MSSPSTSAPLRARPRRSSLSALSVLEPLRPLTADTHLHVDRLGIEFETVDHELVRLRIEVRNLGAGSSPPTRMAVRSAPFGAFLPTRELTTLAVPALPGGHSVTLETLVRRPPAPDASGSSGVVHKALTALASDGDDERADRLAAALLGAARPATLAPDVLEATGVGGIHWAGNVHVFFGDRAVERHRSGPLRISPGRRNITSFCLGSDEVELRVEGSVASWPHRIREFDHGARWARLSRILGAKNSLVARRLALPAKSVQLEIDVPRDAVRSELEVHVERRADGACAVVEYELDPLAAGPGCRPA